MGKNRLNVEEMEKVTIKIKRSISLSKHAKNKVEVENQARYNFMMQLLRYRPIMFL